MAAQSGGDTDLIRSLEALRAEVERLGQRITVLETAQQSLDHEELILTISAAVAAYLGEEPTIRQVRLISNPQWVAHGRATIQASHRLNTQRS